VKEDMEIVEDRGDGDGFLDPGETGDMVVTLTNYGQVNAENVEATLISEDELVTVHTGYAAYGSLESGGGQSNSGSPFVLEADPSAPTGHFAGMKLLVNADEAEYADTIAFWLQVGPFGGDFLVWDPDATPSSGSVIRDRLETLGYTGMYVTGLSELRTFLPNFGAIFITMGIYPNDYMIPAGSATAETLVSYLTNHGGNLFMEGGDIWYYHPGVGGHDFGPYFNINATGDGGGDLNTAEGQTGTFTQGMSFAYGGENNWIDHIEPIQPAVKIFNNPADNQGCGVAYDADTYRTVGLSFELGGLVDGDEPSTKAMLLDSIMTFFGLDTDVEEGSKDLAMGRNPTVTLSPTLTSGASVLRFALKEDSDATVRLFDAGGRLVRDVFRGALGPSRSSLEISTGDLPEGVYFVDVRLGTKRFTRKLLKIRN
jgi:hypothetical protein